MIKKNDNKTTSKVDMRSHGVQVRSRERIENLLSAAETIIIEKGIEGLRMRELARCAGLPIASVYHYFPSSLSVVNALAPRHLSLLREHIEKAVNEVIILEVSEKEKPLYIAKLVRSIVELLLNYPASVIVWETLRRNPELRHLETEHTEKNTDAFQKLIVWAAPTLPKEQIYPNAIIMLEAIQGCILRIINTSQPQQNYLMKSLDSIVISIFNGFQEKN